MRLTSLALFASGLVFALVACRDEGKNGDDDPLPDAPVGGVVKISEIQDPAMPVGTQVELEGVVVTAIDNFGARTGDLWVQDPAGGAFSGIKVFGAPLDQVAALVPGDLVDISNAQKEEFACTEMICGGAFDEGQSITELEGAGGGALSIIKTGTGTMPTPAAVDAKAIAEMTTDARLAEWEKWEGVLITVSNARQIAATRMYGAADDQTEFRITGVARVQSILAGLPAESVFGVCYDKITGIGDYFFNNLILPRSTEDLVVGGTGCNPMATTVVELQGGTNTEVVDLTDAVVIGLDAIGTNMGFWVADAAQGAPNNGVYVYTRDVAPTYAVGTLVNVQGGVDEFDFGSMGNPPVGDTLTEIVDPIHAAGTGTPAIPMPVTVTADIAGDIGAAGEPYEGVLVQISDLTVTNLEAGQGKVELTDNNNNKIIMDDDAFDWTAPDLGDCLTLTGIMSVQVTDNVRTINPRSDLDFGIGVGCT